MKNKNTGHNPAVLTSEKLRRFEKICRAFQLQPGEVLGFLASLVSIPGLLFPANGIVQMASDIIHGYTQRLMYEEADPCRRERAIRYLRRFIRVYKTAAGRPEKERQWAAIESAWSAEAGVTARCGHVAFGKWLVGVSPGFMLHADFWQYQPADLLRYFAEQVVKEDCDPAKPATAFLTACCHVVSKAEFN